MARFIIFISISIVDTDLLLLIPLSSVNLIDFHQESSKMDLFLQDNVRKNKAVIWKLEISRGDISGAGIIKHSVPLLRALLECGYYSREGLI